MAQGYTELTNEIQNFGSLDSFRCKDHWGYPSEPSTYGESRKAENDGSLCLSAIFSVSGRFTSHSNPKLEWATFSFLGRRSN